MLIVNVYGYAEYIVFQRNMKQYWFPKKQRYVDAIMKASVYRPGEGGWRVSKEWALGKKEINHASI